MDRLIPGWRGAQAGRLADHPGLAIAMLALVVGLVCFAVVPPWWHYDEPGHFEYAWLAANSKTWPVVGQYDQSMRRSMARSMLKYNWYRDRNIHVDLSSKEPIPIGVTQVGDKAGYYFLASLPLRMLHGADITVQYYAVRLVSLSLYLLTVIIAWYALGEVLPPRHPLRWMSACMLALLPAFVDEMVSVNNDVAAVLAATLFLWAAFRLLMRGYSVGRVSFLLLALTACYLSKGTALFAFLLAPLVLVFGILRGRHVPVVWGLVGLVLAAVVAMALQGGAPAAWYTESRGLTAARTEAPGAPLGSRAFELTSSAGGMPARLAQIVPPQQVKALRNQTVTIGGWMWATSDTSASPPQVVFWTRNALSVSSSVSSIPVATRPAFVRSSVSVPSDALYAIVYLDSGSASGDAVFLDGLVLVPGMHGNSVPGFVDAAGRNVIWDGKVTANLIRNGSAEQGAFQVRPFLDSASQQLQSVAAINIPLWLTSSQDPPSVSWWYRASAQTLFRTFWISLANDKTGGGGTLVLYYLLVLTVAGGVGAVVYAWSKRASLRWDVVGILALAVIIPWALALLRGLAVFGEQKFLYPWARYAFPAILPTALVLCAGWYFWLGQATAKWRPGPAIPGSIFLSTMAGISIFGIGNAIEAFHPGWSGWISGMSLFLVQAVIFFLVFRRWRRPAQIN